MNYDDEHRKHLMAYLQQVERLFYQLVGTAVFIALKTDYKELITSTLFAFANTKKGKAFDKELINFSNQLDQIIKQGITKEWAFANLKQDKLLREGLTKHQNLEALEDEGEIYESIEEIWPDYPTEEDYLWKGLKL